MFTSRSIQYARSLAAPTNRGAVNLSGFRLMATESAANNKSRSNTATGLTTYSALIARLDLKFEDPKTMEQVCTHKSYERGRLACNDRMQWVGKRVLNLFVGEHLAAKYPNLSVEMLQDLQHAYFGLSSLAEVGRHFGMQPALRWESVVKEAPEVGLTKVLGKSVQALVGAVYQEQGALSAKDFVHKHILGTRTLDVESIMQIKNPKLMLVALTKEKGLPRPVARILKETGRFTSSPVFVIGIFCDTKMIGMGFGSSLKMGEYRASKDALIKHYAKEIKDFNLPSVGEGNDADVTFFPPNNQDSAVRA
ncbi:54S ribosomal protein L3 mitochondrial [Coemansia sp. RSA 988]|nr:54S ribosomal protein L3 mitochondrial [Coemansia sp. RSA 988]